MRWSDSCPACGKTIRWYYLLDQLMAPFFFRCRYCLAQLRLKDSFHVIILILLVVVVSCGAIVLGMVAGMLFLPEVWMPWRIVGAGGLGALAGMFVNIVFPFQGGLLREQQEDEGAYLLAFLLAMGGAILVALTLAVFIGLYAARFD